MRSIRKHGEDISFPEINVPPAELESYLIFIYGEKGIGKTSFAAKFDNPVNFQWEPGRRNLRIRQIPNYSKNEPPLTWPRFCSYLELILPRPDVSTIVIDTVDRCYDAALSDVCFNMGIGDPNEIKDYGATWRKIKRLFEDALIEIIKSGKTLVLISHSVIREIPSKFKIDEDGKAMVKAEEMVVPSCSTAAWLTIKAFADIAVYMGWRRSERVIYVRGSESIWSACGIEDKFNGINEIPMGSSAEEGYRNFVSAFHGERVWEGGSKRTEFKKVPSKHSMKGI